ncbi:malate dehydrogenase (quinone) [Halomonas halocynthiae]|uniref:malate dehydrogenase (quinone) n=1 Tax=Halomonas halocynthiae TaxID=176290 RepID=UPI000429A1C3|nr:malate dehydrogenase (quinone) [Halomonas halocynthiae]
MSNDLIENVDVVLVGAGIMSATVGTLLKELEPSLSIAMFERLDDCARESSAPWNNAGTGHAANCEMNYTPPNTDGTVNISKALEVNTEFDLSRQLWSYLVTEGKIADPGSFIHACPHVSFVRDKENVRFLQQRYRQMSAHHCYETMQYSDDPVQLREWAPLVMDGRPPEQNVAMTRVASGADVDYGALTHALVSQLAQQDGATIHYQHDVVDLYKNSDGTWRVYVKNLTTHETVSITAKFVFVGAGGRAIELLQKSNIPEGKGYGGFPISGIWLRCDDDTIAEQHHAKVYGKAAKGSPPMSVPHLDTRIIDGKRSLLFGPYAGFSTRFLKHGSYLDLMESVKSDNVLPMLDVAKDNWSLSEYLISQVVQSSAHQFDMLKEFYPKAQHSDWHKAVAGQRVQIIKPERKAAGTLEFGTELITSEDKSFSVLLGASPGASTAAYIAINVLETCFSNALEHDGWKERLSTIIPTYGIDLKVDAQACRDTRQHTSKTLKLNHE